MTERDVHFAVAMLHDNTRAAMEARGFVEDLFRDCRNCTPTRYHATFRGDGRELTPEWWAWTCDILRADPTFNGLLGQEILVREFRSDGAAYPGINVSKPLPIQTCPPERHKACDVHIGVKVDEAGYGTLSWLDELSIASFSKARPDGIWRIHTATFDAVAAGARFLHMIAKCAPRKRGTQFKIKLERIERAFRHPADAVTLPLTYEAQLDAWLTMVSSHAET